MKSKKNKLLVLLIISLNFGCDNSTKNENDFRDYLIPKLERKRFVSTMGYRGEVIYKKKVFSDFTLLKSIVKDSVGNIKHILSSKIYDSEIIVKQYINNHDSIAFPYAIKDSMKYLTNKLNRGLSLYSSELKETRVLITDTSYFDLENELLIFEGIAFQKSERISFKKGFKHVYKKNFGIFKSNYYLNDSLIHSKKYY